MMSDSLAQLAVAGFTMTVIALTLALLSLRLLLAKDVIDAVPTLQEGRTMQLVLGSEEPTPPSDAEQQRLRAAAADAAAASASPGASSSAASASPNV